MAELQDNIEKRPQFCVRCHYDLRSLPTSLDTPCPECGFLNTPVAQREWAAAIKRRRRWLWFGAVVSPIAGAMIGTNATNTLGLPLYVKGFCLAAVPLTILIFLARTTLASLRCEPRPATSAAMR